MDFKFHGKYSNAFNHIDKYYNFRFNVVSHQYEFRKIKGLGSFNNWIKFDDRQKNSIVLDLLATNIECPSNMINTFIESPDFSKDYNPFKTYFENLKPYKSKKDYISKFASTIDVEDRERFEDIFKRFLVGTINCLLNENSTNDVCLVFQAGQGIGKTRWMRSLLPKQFQAEYIYEGHIDTRNKDHNLYLSQYWFIHLDELETLKSNEIGAIKAYITRERINERVAYARHTSNFVRRASFLGSVNDDKFLSDTTGNRRWLVFKVLGVNYQHGLNTDKLWAQAYDLYKSGYRSWFNTDEIKGINSANEEFREISMEEELIMRFFDYKKKSKDGQYFSSSEMAQLISYNVPEFNSKINIRTIGKVNAKFCKNKKRASGINKYWCTYTGKELLGELQSLQNNNNKNDFIDPKNDDLPF